MRLSGPLLKTYPEWDRTALEHCWDSIDYLSLHNYATNYENDTAGFLAYAVEFEEHIDDSRGAARATSKAEAQPQARRVPVLGRVERLVQGPRAPTAGGPRRRTLLEEDYNLEDALVVAQ